MGFGERRRNEAPAAPEPAGSFERIGAGPNDADDIRGTPEAVERMIAQGRAGVAATIEKPVRQGIGHPRRPRCLEPGSR
jgi:hypothetical protein